MNPSTGACNFQTRPMSRSFTNRFIFRCILQYSLSRKWKLRSVHERIINIRSDKGKPNVNNRLKNAIFRGFSFGDWLVGPERYS